MIPILNVVLFKTADSTLDIREKAAQLLQLLERYLLPFFCERNGILCNEKTMKV